MNAPTPPVPAKFEAAPKPNRADQEFLPAALELLETPPSPNHVAFMLTICALVVVALLWGYFGHIDIVATAQGKIQPTGRVKVIQPLETAKVSAVHVSNGKKVSEGELLVEFDPSEAQADVSAVSAALSSFKAESIRRRAVLAAVAAKELTPPALQWDETILPATRQREERVLKGDLGQLAAILASIDAQISQKTAERDRLAQTVIAQYELIKTIKQRVDMRSTLVDSKSGSKASLIDAMETYQYQQTVLAMHKGQLAESNANLNVLAREKDKARDTFIADNGQKLGEAERQIDDLTQRLVKATTRLARMHVRSPISGTVLGLSVTTLGQVVLASEEMMRIVPADARLEIEAYLQNKDVGFVKPGQMAVIKVESFPFTRYGTLEAKVLEVARDAIPEPDASTQEGNPAKAAKNQTFAGAQRVQNLVFPVTLQPTTFVMEADGARVPLSPGMAVSVEIKTGSRRIIEYVFSPVVEVASTAMKER